MACGRRSLASVAASLCYNFFFLPPIYTFTITDPVNVAAFVLFTIVAVLVSHVAARGRTQTVAAQGRVRTLESLYAFSRKLAGAGTLDDVLWATAYQTALMLDVRVVLLLPENGAIAVKAGYPPEDTLGDADLAAASWVWENNRSAGRGSDTLPGAKRLFLPMRTGRGSIGIVGIDSDKPGPMLTPDRRRLLDALIDQGALAIERVHLVEDLERSAAPGGDRPAALGAADLDLARSQDPARLGLGGGRHLARSLPRAHRRAEGRSARNRHRRVGAAQPLHRQPARHDQARIRRRGSQHRAARRRRDRRQRAAARRQDSGAASCRARARRRAADAGARCGAVRAGAVQSPGQCREILPRGHHHPDRGLARAGARVQLQVLDEGEGIPAADLERIFDKFHRAQKGDHVRAGTGLGLAISRGFVEAMQGTITAANRSDRSGAVFTIALPVPPAREKLDTAA